MSYVHELREHHELELYYGAEIAEELFQDIHLERPLFFEIKLEEKCNSIGFVGLNEREGYCEPEIYILRKYRRKGYGKAALLTLLEATIRKELKILDIESCGAVVFEPGKIGASVGEECYSSDMQLKGEKMTEQIKHNENCMKKEKTDLYIVHKSSIQENDMQLLKLNREEHQLEMYQRVDNETLHKYYSIREDFDSSEYAMFEKMKAFPCVFGGEKSPTPKGMFRIERKSKDEYISGYHAKYEKVKFFGYLVIFEDYFIHSDMYLEYVTENMMRKGGVESISKTDTCTAGCIRVRQEEVDWLVENVEVGCNVVM